MIAKSDLAWMAGVLDLRANTLEVCTGKVSHRYLELQVTTYEQKVAERLYRMVGHQVRSADNRPPKEFERRGCTEHCQHKHVEYHILRPRYTWQVRGTSAAIIMWNVLPYMTHSDMGFREIIAEIFENTPYYGKAGNAGRGCIQRLSRLGWKMPPHLQERAGVDEEGRKVEAA